MNTKQLNDLLDELSKHHRSKEVIMLQAVEARLNASSKSYLEELENSVKYLSIRKPLNLMKRLNK